MCVYVCVCIYMCVCVYTYIEINSSSRTKAISDEGPREGNPLRMQKALVMLSWVSYLSRAAILTRTMSGDIGEALLSLQVKVCDICMYIYIYIYICIYILYIYIYVYIYIYDAQRLRERVTGGQGAAMAQ